MVVLSFPLSGGFFSFDLGACLLSTSFVLLDFGSSDDDDDDEELDDELDDELKSLLGRGRRLLGSSLTLLDGSLVLVWRFWLLEGFLEVVW